MKKIITLLIAAGAFATAIAQTDSRSEEARRVILGPRQDYPTQNPRDVVIGRDDRSNDDNRYPGTYPSNTSRQREIDQINRDYDRKIQSIRNNRHLSAQEKERIIRDLERQRNQQIREVNDKYRRYEDDRRYNDRRRYEDDDDYYRKEKKYKKNNGKHLGWEKGRGNPHKRYD
ncbi:MAG: hypothetical protein ICV84_15690 [Flavisolibacter sp.]|nr:hypothetical protein [Flavisolibacter sp.]